jgi:omega-hydroxy-beta-dihydromenaquinone-9 sulfotransferase
MTTQNDPKKQKNNRTVQHPLFGISVRNWIQLLEKNGGVDTEYIPRMIFITLISILTIPARILFKIKYRSKINNTNLSHPPVFIIGHWRSGTTYLHELLCQDPQFCYVSLWNTLLPDSFLILEPIKKFLSRFLPSERPMDEIKVEIDGPYEDEAALAVLYPWSFFHCLHFPKNAEEQYVKSIHFYDMTSEEKNQWKMTYQHFIKTVTFANHGKRFLSKNPSNTARVTVLLELFPEAHFIHIYRNPYKVYLSTKKMRHNVLDKLALQHASEEDLEQQVLQNYIRLMNSYFEQYKQIRNNRLIEIKYEDLISNPLEQVHRIYSTLKLPGFEDALPKMKKYLKKQSNYHTNVYTMDDEIIQHVNKNWKFTIDQWRYTPPM